MSEPKADLYPGMRASREYWSDKRDAEIVALRARVAELEVIAISICAGNCLPPFPCHQDGCPKRTASNKDEVRK